MIEHGVFPSAPPPEASPPEALPSNDTFDPAYPMTHRAFTAEQSAFLLASDADPQVSVPIAGTNVLIGHDITSIMSFLQVAGGALMGVLEQNADQLVSLKGLPFWLTAVFTAGVSIYRYYYNKRSNAATVALISGLNTKLAAETDEASGKVSA